MKSAYGKSMFLYVALAMALSSSAQQPAPSKPLTKTGQSASTVSPVAAVATPTPVTTSNGGTKGTIPVFTGASTIESSNLYSNSTGLGIGRIPAGVLDVNGKTIIRGLLDVSRSADATPTAGAPSFPFLFQASVYDSALKGNLIPYYAFESEPAGNNTANAGATLNLLYYSGLGANPVESGIYINPNGNIHFAPTQTFPITTGPQGPAGPTGPAGPAGPTGPAGPAGPAGSVPANLTALSGQLSTNGGVAYLGSDRFQYPGACVIGDVFLSVNGYGSGNALPADGRAIPILGNTALFTLIGISFGGNGTSNFQLPDLRAFAPKGMQYSICLNGTFPSEN